MHLALHFLGQSYTTTDTNSGSATMLGIVVLIILTAIIFMVFVQAKVYMKAGRKWWESLVPFYNVYILQKIVGRPGWWLVLYFIPFVNIVVAVINMFDLAKSFGHGTGTALMLIFFPAIMYPLMALSSDYVYKGPLALERSTIEDTPYPNNIHGQNDTSDTTGPQPPTSTEPAPTAPEVPTSTPPENLTKQQ